MKKGMTAQNRQKLNAKKIKIKEPSIIDQEIYKVLPVFICLPFLFLSHANHMDVFHTLSM